MIRVVLLAALLAGPGCQFPAPDPKPPAEPPAKPATADAGAPLASVALPAPAPLEGDSGAARADVYTRACRHLAELGCSTGRHPRCAELMRQADHDRIANVDEACLLAAPSVAKAKACGFVRCLP